MFDWEFLETSTGKSSALRVNPFPYDVGLCIGKYWIIYDFYTYSVTWQHEYYMELWSAMHTLLAIVLKGALRTSEKEVWERGNCELPDLKSAIWRWLITDVESCEVPPRARGESSKSLPSVDVPELPPVEGRSLMLPNEPEPLSFLRDKSDDEPHAFGAGDIVLSPHGKSSLHSSKHRIRQHNIINNSTGKQSRFVEFSIYFRNTHTRGPHDCGL